jgi:hypothetical protein
MIAQCAPELRTLNLDDVNSQRVDFGPLLGRLSKLQQFTMMLSPDLLDGKWTSQMILLCSIPSSLAVIHLQTSRVLQTIRPSVYSLLQTIGDALEGKQHLKKPRIGRIDGKPLLWKEQMRDRIPGLEIDFERV